mgnify:CR=1 FL=1
MANSMSNRLMSKKLVRHDLFSEIGEFLDSIPASMKRAATEEYKKFLHLKMGNFQLLKLSLNNVFEIYRLFGYWEISAKKLYVVVSIFYTFFFLSFCMIVVFHKLVSSATHRFGRVKFRISIFFTGNRSEKH